MNNHRPELLTVNELADYLRIGIRTAYHYVTDGTVPAVKVGGQWRIRRSELDRMLSSGSAIPPNTTDKAR